ncbi:hypothetical protein [Flavobacterium selenitireducens]|uniref:hypothetical protein n=1 Tax=Flavobacterium selenitireducens TaxID=2722704 RepID=UPI00168A77B9|nr:hypothetical protein [Flavobacterium selenitireducens]MBD3581066.1 hypothetical protein [Flavobacterium selenitireducens]
MRGKLLILVFFLFTDAVVFSQTVAANEPQSLTLEQFNTLVDRSIAVLKTKTAISMTEKEHIGIMMSINTLTFTLDGNRKRIYTDGRYRQLEDTVRSKNYMKEAMKVFPDCIPKGLGVYFPKLNVEFYGTPSEKYRFKII